VRVISKRKERKDVRNRVSAIVKEIVTEEKNSFRQLGFTLYNLALKRCVGLLVAFFQPFCKE
jgi:hypothetical protein